MLSSNVRTEVPKLGRNGTASPTLNDNALWFAVAPVLVGTGVNGSQTLFYRPNLMGLPQAYTRAPFPNLEEDYEWSINNVTSFIEVSIGAVAQASSRNNQTGLNTTIISNWPTRKLYPGRALYLVVPVVIILLGQMTLLYWTACMHHTEGLSIMRMAGFAELLKSALTDFFLDSARENCKPDEVSHFGKVKVKFGCTTLLNTDVAGLMNVASESRRGSKDEDKLENRPYPAWPEACSYKTAILIDIDHDQTWLSQPAVTHVVLAQMHFVVKVTPA